MARLTSARRGSSPGVSFFAFQDIITAVVGIFILITVIMILELIEKVETKSQSPAGDIATIARVIQQTKAAADEIEAKLSSMTNASNRQSEALAVADTATAESLRQQLKVQRQQSKELDRQVAVVERQVADAKRRLAETEKETRSQRDIANRKAEQAIEEAGRLERRAGKLKDATFPLYNGTLDDGRALVVIRLGHHPGRDGASQDTAQISMRDGDARRRRTYRDVDDLKDDLRSRNHRTSHYVIHIAPGGAEDFKELQEFLDSRVRPIRYGFDVTGPDDDVQLMFEIEDEEEDE